MRPTTFGGVRPATLLVPSPLVDGKQYPLVVVLHGYGANGFAESAYLGTHTLPQMGKAFVIEPDGLVDSTGKQYWNADPYCCDLDHTNPDDVRYLGGLIDDVTAAWPVDPEAVLVVGHSNGGYMAYRLACDRADVVSNIAVLAGVATSTPCNPSRAVEVLHIHGTADTLVPYDGGGIAAMSALGSVQQWAGHDRCGTTLTTGAALDLESTLPGAETQVQTVDGCPAGTSVTFWSIVGGSHIPLLGPAFTPDLMGWLGDHRRS